MSQALEVKKSIPLRKKTICPNCWDSCAPHEVLWIASHTDLIGDPLLGPDEQLRFQATRFTPSGDAIDVRGQSCHRLACPHCHLPMPRACLEMAPFFLSIVGAPASGKSYFLAAMTWELKRSLQRTFGLSFVDADAEANRILNDYQQTLFESDAPTTPVSIAKTPLVGDLYQTVTKDGHTVSRPRPLVYSLQAQAHHPYSDDQLDVAKAFCLYDNAGEHFLPGQDRSGTQVTQHLAQSQVLFFLFDPSQNTQFRTLCSAFSTDPQLSIEKFSRVSQQDAILNEVANRIRRYAGLSQNQKHDRPLVIIVTKCDTWQHLIDFRGELPWQTADDGSLSLFEPSKVDRVSNRVRDLLLGTCPQFVNAAESLANEIVYIPASATGVSPTIDPGTNTLLVTPDELKPVWVSVPLIYSLNKWSSKMILSH